MSLITPGGHALPLYAGKKTSGVLVLPDGDEIPIESGFDGPSMKTRGIPGMHNRIKSHVEAHASVVLRERRVPEATLDINRVPCPTMNPISPGCSRNLPRMLPEGSKSRVIGPDGYDETFIGLPDPIGTNIIGL